MFSCGDASKKWKNDNDSDKILQGFFKNRYTVKCMVGALCKTKVKINSCKGILFLFLFCSMMVDHCAMKTTPVLMWNTLTRNEADAAALAKFLKLKSDKLQIDIEDIDGDTCLCCSKCSGRSRKAVKKDPFSILKNVKTKKGSSLWPEEKEGLEFFKEVLRNEDYCFDKNKLKKFQLENEPLLDANVGYPTIFYV